MKKVGLPQIHCSRRVGQRRFCEHAEIGRTPLLGGCTTKNKPIPGPDPDRWRARPVARGRRGAREARSDQSTRREHCETGRNYLRAGPGGSANPAGASLAAFLHLIQQIRDETHRFAVGFHRQRRAQAHDSNRPRKYSRRWSAHGSKTPSTFRQHRATSRGRRRAAFERRAARRCRASYCPFGRHKWVRRA